MVLSSRFGKVFVFITELMLCVTAPAADIVWTNLAGGNWNVTNNWSPNQVPSTNDTAWITNDGVYTVTVNANVTLNGLVLGGDSGTQTLNHATFSLTLNGPGSSSSNGVYTFASGTLTGSGALQLAGPFNWVNGVMGSAGSTLVVEANGGLNISGANPRSFLGGTLVNGGVGSWSAGQIQYSGTALFSNAPAGTFDFTADGSAFSLSGGNPSVANAGTMRKTGGTGTSIIGIPCNNSGSIQILSGTLSLTDGGVSGGQFSGGSGATVNFGGGTHTLLSSSGVGGPGGVSVSGGASLLVQGTMAVGNLTNSGTLNFNSQTTDYITNLSMGNGVLNGTNSTLVTGPFNWVNGVVGSAGSTLVVEANGGLNISGANPRSFLGGTLVNGGAGSWSAGQTQCQGTALFSNAPAGTFDFTADGSAFALSGGSPLVANAGTMRKTGGTGTSTIGVPCNNSGAIQANSGVLAFSSFIQNVGQTILNGGNFSFTQTALLQGGILSGSGTVTGSVSNNAVVSPGASPGLLSITGNYIQTANAHLQIVLGGTLAGTNYDQLSVGGAAVLDGTLDLSYTNGFMPSLGDVFTVLVCAVRSGGFPTITGPVNTLATVYTTNAVLVEPGNAPPVAQLQVALTQTACRTFVLKGAGTDPDGSVTNVTLMLGTNVLVSSAGSFAQAGVTFDFPGELTLTALTTDNLGAQGATNVTVTITPGQVLVLDPIGFQTNSAFKLCMCGETGTNYQILANDNLSTTNWMVLGTMENTNGIWRYSDKTATNSMHRLYRARQLP